jgi:RNA polymerase sigma-70 factor (ECF subfamily)
MGLFSRKPGSAEFETAALPHLNDLFRTAARILGDTTRADDVIQDVYLLAWKNFGQFQPGTNCRAWLYKILFYSLHHYRRKWMNPRLVVGCDDTLVETAAAMPPVPDRLTDEEILTALSELPPDYRAVVLLVDVEEFSYRETAEILNVPAGTVMSRLSRGRRLLREALSKIARSYGIGMNREGMTA